MKGIKYTAKEKENALKKWIVDGEDVFKVAKKTKCTIQSLYRWRRAYDGTTDSLKNKSSRPHTPHPNAHTPEETAKIAEVFKSHPDISYAEALGILRTDYGYARTYGGFYRFLRKYGYYILIGLIAESYLCEMLVRLTGQPIFIVLDVLGYIMDFATGIFAKPVTALWGLILR